MIIGASTGQGFRGTLSYVHKEQTQDLTAEQKPQILELNNVYGTTKQQAQQMRFVAQGNSRSSRPVLHLSVSFHKNEKISPKQRDEILKQVVKEVGATPENNQYVIAKHNDADHEHYHIVLNKVGFDGKNIDTSYIKNKCQVIADKIELEKGLLRTQGRTVVYAPETEKGYRFTTKAEREIGKTQVLSRATKDKRKHVQVQKNVFSEAINRTLADTKIQTPEAFKEALAKQNIEVRYTVNTNGISGVSFKNEKLSVKGSDLKCKWGDLNKALNVNKDLSKEYNLGANIDQNTAKNTITTDVQDKGKQIEDLSKSIKLSRDIESLERFKGQLTDLRNHTRNVLLETKEKAYRGERIALTDSQKVSVIADETGKIFVQHKDNSSLKFEVKEVDYIAKYEAKKGQEDRKYQRDLKQYNEVKNAQLLEAPSKLEFWRVDERKKALEYNARLKLEKQRNRAPQQTIYVGKDYKMYTIENIEKARLTTQSKIDTMKIELDKTQQQSKEVVQQQERKLTRFEEAKQNRAERERTQEPNKNRGRTR